MSKELKAAVEAICKWIDANDKEVAFIGSFVAFDKEKLEANAEDCVKEDCVVAYGVKECLKVSLDEMQEQLTQEKDDFVNW